MCLYDADSFQLSFHFCLLPFVSPGFLDPAHASTVDRSIFERTIIRSCSHNTFNNQQLMFAGDSLCDRCLRVLLHVVTSTLWPTCCTILSRLEYHPQFNPSLSLYIESSFLALPYRSIEQTEKPSDSDVLGDRRRGRGYGVLAVRPISFALALTHIILSAFLVGIHLSVTVPALFSA